jgi:hypothetical protein
MACTVSGHIRDLSATAIAGGKAVVRFELKGYGAVQPRASNASEYALLSLVKDVNPDASGAISASFVRNDEITADTANTYYQVTLFVNGVQQGPPLNFRFTSPTFNLDTGSQYIASSSGISSTTSSVDELAANAIETADLTVTDDALIQTLNAIRFADQFSGADMSAKISAAYSDLPSTGGTIDARGLEGAQTWSTGLTISKPIKLLLGTCNITSTIASAATPMLSISADFHMEGISRAATTITTHSGGDVFKGLGTTVEYFWVKNVKMTGGGSTSQCFTIGDWSNGVLDWQESSCGFENCNISSFGDYAVELGQSAYFFRFIGNRFELNAGSLYMKRFCEYYVRDNFFYGFETGTSNAHIKVIGTSIGTIQGNAFQRGGVTTTAPDILVSGPAAADGFIRIYNNKHGAESESNARYKLVVDGTSTFPMLNLEVVGNYYGCVTGQSAINLVTSIGYCKFNDNITSECTTFINDAQSIADQLQAGNNECVNNRFISAATYATALFTNAGRGFTRVSGNTPGPITDEQIGRLGEAPELRNRISGNSEDVSGWTKSGITVTTGQTDPFGTTRACLLTRSTTGTDFIQQTVSNSSIGKSVWVSFWAKAGTATRVSVSFYSVTQSKSMMFRTFLIDSTWRRYKFRVGGLTTTDTFRFYYYPEYSGTNTGTISVFGAQVSDYDSDYYPAAGSAVSTTAYGTRGERGAQYPHILLSAAAQTAASGQVSLGATTASTVGAAGGASALPATPSGYLIVNIAGTQFKIPYYAN